MNKKEKLNKQKTPSTSNRNNPNSDPHFEREKSKYENPVASREFILETISQHGNALSFSDICSIFSADDEHSKIGIQRRLRAMEREGQLQYTRDRKYKILEASQLIKGIVIGHRDGFGFLKHSPTEKDYFISAGQMNNLLHGDEVEGSLGQQDRKGRQEFNVSRVTKPRTDAIVGRYYSEQGLGFVIPDDSRICQEIIIPKQTSDKAKLHARQGNVVVVEITQRPHRRSNAVGKIVEVLGEHMAPGMEIETALRNFDIPHTWPKPVSNYVRKFGNEVPEDAKQGRKDLTSLPLVTIDGEDARDFDDAVYCRKTDSGWRLWVAIADVSSYVKLGTALDAEAQNRATSVYFPEQVIPMLPEVLSNGLCSLNPDVDRLCMVCEVNISSAGKVEDYQFYEAVMRSHARLTYTKVWDILNGDETLRERYHDRVDDLEQLYDLYKCLKTARNSRGAIEFETLETKFVFDVNRKIEHIVPITRNDAHKVIEECMIMANVCAAKYIEKHQAESLFRVHDKPDADRLTSFRAYLSEVGVNFVASDEPSPRDFADLAKRIDSRADKELIQTMLLRSMKQAVYEGSNIGHFGLSLDAYAHFTSPIRRYPDLVVHRTIKGIINKQAGKKVCKGAKLYTEEEIDALGEQCSMAERRADDATRDVADWLKCEFMQDHVGDVFDGVVASVTNFGLFVRINDYQIDGLIHITSLSNDYYHFDEVKQCLIGESTGVSYRLGDPLRIKVAAVNLDERKIDLMLDGVAQIDASLNPHKKGRDDAQAKGKAPKPASKSKNAGKSTRKPKNTGKRKAGPSSKKNKASRSKPRRK